MQHKYRIQYQSFLNVMSLKDIVVEFPDDFMDFRNYLFRYGWLLDDKKTCIAPGCIQQVIQIS